MNVGPKADARFRPSVSPCNGLSGRYDFVHPPEEYDQVRRLYRDILTEQERTNLVFNICQSLGACRQDVRNNMLRLFYKVDEDYGNRVSQGLGLKEGEASGGILDKIGKVITNLTSTTSSDNKMHTGISEDLAKHQIS